MFINSDCSFTNCSSKTNGGAIYFKCDSSIVQYRSCGYKSITYKQEGHHSYCYLVDKSKNKNYLYECSFYECGNLDNWRTNLLYYGNIESKSINTSFCKAEYDSGIDIRYSSDQGNISYSSFCNTTSGDSVIQLDFSNYDFKFCNVHSNQCKHILWAGKSNVLIENCSFIDTAKSGNDFIQKGEGLITIKNTYCNRFITSGLVSSENVHNIYFFHKLAHYSSYHCEAQYPLLMIKPKIISLVNDYQYSSFFIISFGILFDNFPSIMTKLI